jgi:hypothetical protein
MDNVTIIEMTPFENFIIEVPGEVEEPEEIGFDYTLDLVLS